MRTPEEKRALLLEAIRAERARRESSIGNEQEPKAEMESLQEKPRSWKRAIGIRAIPAVKSALTAGIAPHLLDPVEEKLFGKEYRPQNRKEEHIKNFWEGAGGYSTGMLGGAGVAKLAAKGLHAIGKPIAKKIGTSLLGASSNMVKAAPSIPGAIATGLTAEHIEPITRKLTPAVGIPLNIAGSSLLHGGVGALSKPFSIIPNAVGLKRENVEAFRKAGIPYTLGDVAPKRAKGQTAAQLMKPSPKLEKIYEKRRKVFEGMTPTNFDTRETAERIIPAAEHYAASQREIQSKLSNEVSKEMQKAGITTFTPTKSRKVLTDYFESLSKEGAKGGKAYELPKKLQNAAKPLWADDVPISEARKAGEGIIDRLTKILPEQRGVPLTREQGIASRLRKAIADDIFDEIERRAPQIAKTEKIRKSHWAGFIPEQKQHVPILQLETNPKKRLAKVVNDFENDGEIFPRLLENTPKEEQKDFFNSVLRHLATYRDTQSINYLAKRFNTLSKPNQEFLLKNMHKFNGVDPDQLEALFKSQQLAGVTEKTLNTSRTASTSAVYKEQQALADAAKDLFAGNPTEVIKGIKRWVKHPIAATAAGFKNEHMYSSKNFINMLYKMSKVHKPSSSTSALNKAWLKIRTPVEELGPKRVIKAQRALKAIARPEEDNNSSKFHVEIRPSKR